MLNLKKTAVAVLAFSSSAVFAGTMGPVCAPGNVTVPCEATAWDFGAQALYLQQSYEGSAGFFIDPRAVNNAEQVADAEALINGDFGRRNHHNDRWNWGFQIEGSYHFNTGNDVDVNWYHLNSGNHRDHGNFVLDPDNDNDVDLRIFNHGNRTQWDAVNFEFGQHVDFSQWTKIRFHEGAQYARIQTPTFFALVDAGGVLNLFNHGETYNGFGPRGGADVYYDVGNGFALYGKAAAAVLAGTNKGNNFGGFTNNHHNRTVMVPELEGKLGAKYTYAMASGDLTLDVGYMWVDYLNARVRTVGRNDFGLNGLYFGGKWVGNVA